MKSVLARYLLILNILLWSGLNSLYAFHKSTSACYSTEHTVSTQAVQPDHDVVIKSAATGTAQDRNKKDAAVREVEEDEVISHKQYLKKNSITTVFDTLTSEYCLHSFITGLAFCELFYNTISFPSLYITLRVIRR